MGRGTVGIILAAALALRLGAVEVVLRAYPIRFADSQLYEAYAKGIVERGEFAVGEDRAQRSPGYPLFLAGCWTTFGKSERSVLFVQTCLSTLTCWLTYRLTQRLAAPSFDPSVPAIAAAAFLAFEPFSVALTALELTETLFATLLMASVVSLSGASNRTALIGGVIGGLAVLVRPSVLLLPIVAAPIALTFAADRKNALRIAIAFTVGFVVVQAPWWIRNASVFGRFVPTTLNVGESLYDGLRPGADGSSQMEFTRDPEIRKLSEIERDRHWFNAAVGFARENPRRVFELAMVKIGRFWSPWPNEISFRKPAIVAATTLATIPLFAFAAVGLFAGPTTWRARLLLAVPIVYFMLLHAIFVSSVRYRVPVTPLLCVLAGFGWSAGASRQRASTQRALAAGEVA